MSDIRAPVTKPLLIFLPLALFGTIALYNAHSHRLHQLLADKQTELAEQRLQMQAIQNELASQQQQEQVFEDRIAELQQQVASLHGDINDEQHRCQERLAQAHQEAQQIQHQLDDINALHDHALAVERDNTALAQADHRQTLEAYDELREQYNMAKETILRLENSLTQMRVALDEAVQEHQQQIDQLEAHINERIHLARVTPKDADLIRAARLAGVVSFEDPIQVKLTETQKRLDDLQHQYAALDEQYQQLLQTQAAIKQQYIDVVTTLQAQKAVQIDQQDLDLQSAEEQLATLQSELSATRQQLAQVQQDAAATELVWQQRLAALEQENPPSIPAKDDSKQAHIEQTTSDATAESSPALPDSSLSVTLDEQEQVVVNEDDQETASIEPASIDSTVAQTIEETAPEVVNDGSSVTKPAIAPQNCILDAAFSQFNGKNTDQGVLLQAVDSELRFSSDTAELPDDHLPSLDRIAELLQQYPQLVIYIEGHTDSLGNDLLNQQLSQARADAVKNALITRGIAATRLQAQGMGSSQPIADNRTVEGRRRNRRVEVYVNTADPKSSQCHLVDSDL
jgi:outer membrane protein OmpA-like peptidoglycan-associated protein